MTQVLTLAQHTNQNAYWEGGNYELNLSYDSLRDKQWQRILEAIWDHPSVYGPISSRFMPHTEVPVLSEIQVPPPTATLTQHGQMKIGDLVVGCDIQATRSLFECISILIPIGMFSDLSGGAKLRQDHTELETVDKALYDIALQVYDAAPFKIAAIGYERGCQLQVELRSDAVMRQSFLADGNFMAQEDVLKAIEPDITAYEQIRTNLRWMGLRNS
jgi:hypothetical protein